MISNTKEFEDNIEWNIDVKDTFVLFESRRYFTGLILVNNSNLERKFKFIAILAQDKGFNGLVFSYIFYLQLIEF